MPCDDDIDVDGDKGDDIVNVGGDSGDDDDDIDDDDRRVPQPLWESEASTSETCQKERRAEDSRTTTEDSD